MTNSISFYEIAPYTGGLERLDVHDISDDWSNVRDLVQHDLAALDETVLNAVPAANVRPGSNRGGGAHLFAYRVYEPAAGSGVDPVVAGILVSPAGAASTDQFKVSGDIAGESSGDIIFELPPRNVIGWTAMTEAVRDISTILARQADAVVAARKRRLKTGMTVTTDLRQMTKEQFILSTIRPMAEYTFPFLTSVVGIKDATIGEHVGSGLRAIVNGRRAVITARHVIEQAAGYPMKFAVSAGHGRPPYIVSGKIELDPFGDLSVYYLRDDFPVDVPGVSFWPESRIQGSTERLATDFLFTHGFPVSRTRFLRLMEGLASRSLPYGAMQRLEPRVPNLQSYEFAIEFDPTGMRVPEKGGSDGAVDPRGLSGSPVWRIGVSGRSRDEWSPTLSLVVGFLTQWRPDDRVLVASSAGRLTEILNRG